MKNLEKEQEKMKRRWLRMPPPDEEGFISGYNSAIRYRKRVLLTRVINIVRDKQSLALYGQEALEARIKTAIDSYL